MQTLTYHHEPDSAASGDPLTLVAVHGTGGQAQEMLDGWRATLQRSATRPVRLISPQFDTPYQFLLPDADEQLLEAVGDVGGGLCLFGFSGGAQFCHRFVNRHADRVAACCALAAGAWTHPDGSLHGMMIEDGYFDRPPFDDPAIRTAGEQPATADVTRTRWMVGCGTLDLPSRYNSARTYFATLRDLGADVEWAEWEGGHDGEPAAVSDRALAMYEGVGSAGAPGTRG